MAIIFVMNSSSPSRKAIGELVKELSQSHKRGLARYLSFAPFNKTEILLVFLVALESNIMVNVSFLPFETKCYSKYKKCLSKVMLVRIKQHLSHI